MSERAGRAVRPRRIDQIIPSIVEHDAVSNHTFAAQRLLREMGFESEIFAQNIGPGTEGAVQPLVQLARHRDGSQWVLYQSSIGSPAAELFANHPAPKLLDYHNITPFELVEAWLPPLAAEARLGRAQLAMLSRRVRFAFADSPFNAAELDAVGFAVTRVVPVLIEAGNLAARPDASLLERLRREKTAGGADWLFVGQIAPHKAQHDVIKAFACYRQVYDQRARLHLVGREMGNAYRDALRRFVHQLGLDDVVDLPGSLATEALVAYYEAADVFVCCSDHEGFCVPIVEAMSRGLPVVAYGAAAVPDTVGLAGVVLEEKSPPLVAAAVHAVLSDRPTRLAMARAARAQAAQFSLERAEARFHAVISEALELV